MWIGGWRAVGLSFLLSSVVACSAGDGGVEDNEGFDELSEALTPGQVGGPVGPVALPGIPAGCAATAGKANQLRCSTYAGYEKCRASLGPTRFYSCEHINDREGLAINEVSATAYSKIIGGGCTRIQSGQYECKTEAAFANCAAYLRGKSPLTACYRKRGDVSTAALQDRDGDLASALPDCTASGKDWLCDDDSARLLCGAYRRGGSVLIDTCVWANSGPEFRPEDGGVRTTRITAPLSELTTSGAMAATVKRYARVVAVTGEASFTFRPTYTTPAAWPECTPCGPWSSPRNCIPTCQRLDFVSDHLASRTPDALWAVGAVNEGGCTGTISGGFADLLISSTGEAQLFVSEEEDAYVACKTEADRLGRTKWGHTTSMKVYRRPTAMFRFTDPHITHTVIDTPTGHSDRCEYVDNSHIVMRSRTFALTTTITCSE